jgi:hypothetical protein
MARFVQDSGGVRKASSSLRDFKADWSFPYSATPVTPELLPPASCLLTSDFSLQSPVFSFLLLSEIPRETSSDRSMNGLATWS